jgi:hypothetical protein
MISPSMTDDITVDICITTEWRELEGVCMIAELLAKREYSDFQASLRIQRHEGANV